MLAFEQDLNGHKNYDYTKHCWQPGNSTDRRYVDEGGDQQERPITSATKRHNNPVEADLLLNPRNVLDAIENVADAIDLIRHAVSN